MGKAVAVVSAAVIIFSFKETPAGSSGSYLDSLRTFYERPVGEWPKPTIDNGVAYTEMGILPDAPVSENNDSLKGVVQLGKTLFFDPRLSGSNQISCSSCHAPDMHWTDGRRVSIGHDHASNTRNAPTLNNVWVFKKLFWDGRAASLEEQALGPIGSMIEMHQEIATLPAELKEIKGYAVLFKKAFGDPQISQERITRALAVYQQTLVSRKSDFDYFLAGDKKRLNDQQILGLHVFRTKARCMNCHYGPLFTDGDFHNLGLTYYGRKYEDLGMYNITKRAADVGKFKTPGLRDVMRTRPWFHNGLFDNMEGVLNLYNAGMAQPKPRPGQEQDTLFPKTDPLIKKLGLNKEERDAVIAFLESITTSPWRVTAPPMPQ
ncbi:cytochrome-c peroxidase [Chitinophaga nivalis]|uniref:Cytochrome-c peroxidase n=1 Tax=Chitinophaga nivalis TaxID=2991709 RepID=A0ABT3ITT6_9BACT|nr:cytochrome-c peroxidase [Chitinophaga nivalis]MCW3487402.1 cytochrome-c peroxidase [Chitinophaga nivalis]